MSDSGYDDDDLASGDDEEFEFDDEEMFGTETATTDRALGPVDLDDDAFAQNMALMNRQIAEVKTSDAAPTVTLTDEQRQILAADLPVNEGLYAQIVILLNHDKRLAAAIHHLRLELGSYAAKLAKAQAAQAADPSLKFDPPEGPPELTVTEWYACDPDAVVKKELSSRSIVTKTSHSSWSQYGVNNSIELFIEGLWLDDFDFASLFASVQQLSSLELTSAAFCSSEEILVRLRRHSVAGDASLRQLIIRPEHPDHLAEITGIRRFAYKRPHFPLEVGIFANLRQLHLEGVAIGSLDYFRTAGPLEELKLVDCLFPEGWSSDYTSVEFSDSLRFREIEIEGCKHVPLQAFLIHLAEHGDRLIRFALRHTSFSEPVQDGILEYAIRGCSRLRKFEFIGEWLDTRKFLDWTEAPIEELITTVVLTAEFEQWRPLLDAVRPDLKRIEIYAAPSVRPGPATPVRPGPATPEPEVESAAERERKYQAAERALAREHQAAAMATAWQDAAAHTVAETARELDGQARMRSSDGLPYERAPTPPVTQWGDEPISASAPAPTTAMPVFPTQTTDRHPTDTTIDESKPFREWYSDPDPALIFYGAPWPDSEIAAIRRRHHREIVLHCGPLRYRPSGLVYI